MKAKTIDNSPYGFETCIYDNEDYPMGYYVDDLPDKERADKYTNIFNSALSSHVAKETAPLLAEIDRLKKEVDRLESDINKMITIEEFQSYFPSQEVIKKECESRCESGLGRITWYEAIIWLMAEMQKNVRQPLPQPK